MKWIPATVLSGAALSVAWGCSSDVQPSDDPFVAVTSAAVTSGTIFSRARCGFQDSFNDASTAWINAQKHWLTGDDYEGAVNPRTGCARHRRELSTLATSDDPSVAALTFTFAIEYDEHRDFNVGCAAQSAQCDAKFGEADFAPGWESTANLRLVKRAGSITDGSDTVRVVTLVGPGVAERFYRSTEDASTNPYPNGKFFPAHYQPGGKNLVKTGSQDWSDTVAAGETWVLELAPGTHMKFVGKGGVLRLAQYSTTIRTDSLDSLWGSPGNTGSQVDAVRFDFNRDDGGVLTSIVSSRNERLTFVRENADYFYGSTTNKVTFPRTTAIYFDRYVSRDWVTVDTWSFEYEDTSDKPTALGRLSRITSPQRGANASGGIEDLAYVNCVGVLGETTNTNNCNRLARSSLFPNGNSYASDVTYAFEANPYGRTVLYTKTATPVGTDADSSGVVDQRKFYYCKATNGFDRLAAPFTASNATGAPVTLVALPAGEVRTYAFKTTKSADMGGDAADDLLNTVVDTKDSYRHTTRYVYAPDAIVRQQEALEGYRVEHQFLDATITRGQWARPKTAIVTQETEYYAGTPGGSAGSRNLFAASAWGPDQNTGAAWALRPLWTTGKNELGQTLTRTFDTAAAWSSLFLVKTIAVGSNPGQTTYSFNRTVDPDLAELMHVTTMQDGNFLQDAVFYANGMRRASEDQGGLLTTFLRSIDNGDIYRIQYPDGTDEQVKQWDSSGRPQIIARTGEPDSTIAYEYQKVKSISSSSGTQDSTFDTYGRPTSSRTTMGTKSEQMKFTYGMGSRVKLATLREPSGTSDDAVTGDTTPPLAGTALPNDSSNAITCAGYNPRGLSGGAELDDNPLPAP